MCISLVCCFCSCAGESLEYAPAEKHKCSIYYGDEEYLASNWMSVILELWPIGRDQVNVYRYLDGYSKKVRFRSVSVFEKSAFQKIFDNIEGKVVITECYVRARKKSVPDKSVLERIRYYLPKNKSSLTVLYLNGIARRFEIEVFDATPVDRLKLRASLTDQFGNAAIETIGEYKRVLSGGHYREEVWEAGHLNIRILENLEQKHLILNVEDRFTNTAIDSVLRKNTITSISWVDFKNKISAATVPDTSEHGFYYIEYYVDKTGKVNLLKTAEGMSAGLKEIVQEHLSSLKGVPFRNGLGESIKGREKSAMITVGNAVRIIE